MSNEYALQVVTAKPRTLCRVVTIQTEKGPKKYRAYPLAVLASLLGRRPHTIRIWEWRGIIPPPLLRQRKGEQRYYLEPEAKAYRDVFDECRVGSGRSFDEIGFKSLLRQKLIEVRNLILKGDLPDVEEQSKHAKSEASEGTS